MTTPEPFGFTVRHVPEREIEGMDIPDTQPAGWIVHLPHQCDTWDIAGEGSPYDYGVPHDEAITELERFINEAQAALDALRRQEPYNQEGNSW